MKFDKPAETNPIDRLRVVGRAHPRIDGPLKTTGKATYAYEHHDVVTNPGYGVILGSAIGKGRIRSMNLTEAQRRRSNRRRRQPRCYASNTRPRKAASISRRRSRPHRLRRTRTVPKNRVLLKVAPATSNRRSLRHR
jgi:hypothetical protein